MVYEGVGCGQFNYLIVLQELLQASNCSQTNYFAFKVSALKIVTFENTLYVNTVGFKSNLFHLEGIHDIWNINVSKTDNVTLTWPFEGFLSNRFRIYFGSVKTNKNKNSMENYDPEIKVFLKINA